MSDSRKGNKALTYHTSVNEYLFNKEKLSNTTYTRIYGSGYYVEGDELIPEKEFKKRYPIPVTLYSHGKDNADKTKMWMQ